MSFNSKIHFFTLVFALLILFSGKSLYAQSYYKFPVTKAGIYAIPLSTAQSLGESSLNNLAIFGHVGMLPQELSTSDFEIKEIPSVIINGKLLVYLEGPHQLSSSEDTLAYRHHLYSDTAYYWLKTGHSSPVRVVNISPSTVEANGNWLYKVYSFKKEEHNLLSSGRKWYSNRLFSGGISSFNISVESYDEGPIYSQASLMAQSTASSSLSIRSGQINLLETNIAPVPASTYAVKGREEMEKSFRDYFNVGNPTSFNLEMSSTDPNGVGFMDYFLLGLPYSSSNLSEGIYYPIGHANATSFVTKPNYQYWDVTDPNQVKSFDNQNGSATLLPNHKVLVFEADKAKIIEDFTPINLELRNNSSPAELIIISPPSLNYQASRLADHKRSMGISTLLVSIEAIFDNYNFGTKDVTAIRNFIADQYHKHGKLKQVLLFGKGTFDYKNISDGRPNLVPTYSSRNSLHPLTSFSSDDYFGFLQFGQGEWQENEAGDLALSIGVGRIPVINPSEAKNVVDKIIQYEDRTKQLGNWKRKLLFVADDGDYNVHLNHSETHTASLFSDSPEYQEDKLYVDSFEQIQEGNYQLAPAAKESLSDKIEEGTLLVNYIGHGNENTLTAERIFQVSDLENWPETDHFPLFMTATCEFGRHDSPYLRSGAEELLMAQNKGAIALLTTGRPVFSSVNFELNTAFIASLLKKENGQGLMLGDIFKATKNNSLNGSYNRNFSLLGDPTLRLAAPELGATLEIIEMRGSTKIDTLKAGQKIKITGQVTDPLTSTPVNSFNGTFEIELLDQPTSVETLGDESPVTQYINYNTPFYRGTGKVISGTFEAEILVSPNTSQSFDQGILRFFATDSNNSYETIHAQSLTLGGKSANDQDDQQGPTIKLFAEDSLNSVSSTSSTQIQLLANLSDENGIQILGGINQDIALSINDEPPMIINDYYHSIESGYKKGRISITVTGLKEGTNTIKLTAFDNLGNSSTEMLSIEVEGSNRLHILEAKTFPNPTSDISHFWVKHNRPDENIILKLTIYNMLGSEIFSNEKRYAKADDEINDMDWIFLRDLTKIPAKGTYIYRLQLTCEEDGTSDQAFGKINIQ
ncbi:type IX secretion system sortase PorU [Echinicola sp. 20G]|uniref:type IX secretion system sortase PorU n=1 Tax=Echinicola sp. 20G TaxID=2781961 RepID=UPI001910E9FD|nr:type IX secretion system sortase PorU [Echinicola sp. 20G]